jgi:hypothetical protein
MTKNPLSTPIPEFSDVLIPVLALALIVMVAGRVRIRRSGSRR